jgi:hypothetical protein
MPVIIPKGNKLRLKKKNPIEKIKKAPKTIDAKIIKIQEKIKAGGFLSNDLSKLIKVPGDNESVHVLSGGKVSLTDIIITLIKEMGGNIETLFISTLKKIPTHAKIVLMDNPAGDRVVITGSQNLTNYPLTEQFTIWNHKGLYEFYKNWFLENMFDKFDKKSKKTEAA